MAYCSRKGRSTSFSKRSRRSRTRCSMLSLLAVSLALMTDGESSAFHGAISRVMPMGRCPISNSLRAATELSTPPLMRTAQVGLAVLKFMPSPLLYNPVYKGF